MGCQLRVDCTEMYDQTVRTQSGGNGGYLFKKHLVNEKFIIERCGIEAKKLDCNWASTPTTTSVTGARKSTQPLEADIPLLRYPTYRRELLIKNLLDKEYSAYKLGAFAKVVRFTSGCTIVTH